MDQILKSLTDLVNTVDSMPWLRAAVIVVLVLLAAKLVDLFVTGILSRLVVKTETDFDDRLLSLLHRPIFYSVLLIGLAIAAYALDIEEDKIKIAISFIQTIAVFVWFQFGRNLIALSVEMLESRRDKFKFLTPTTAPLIRNSGSLILVSFAVYIIFLIWGINLTAWIASAGIIGLAVGFAAKDTLSNIFGGIAIFADKPFKVGDFINLENGDRGLITYIGVRSTRILTRDDIEVTVPNAILATTSVTNESGGPHEKFRIRVKVGVAYGSDLDRVEDILLSVARQNKDVCEIPKPRVRFREFGDFRLEYELLCWIEKPALRGRVIHELNRAVYADFAENNIKIPVPQRDIRFKNEAKVETHRE